MELLLKCMPLLLLHYWLSYPRIVVGVSIMWVWLVCCCSLIRGYAVVHGSVAYGASRALV